LVSDEVDGEELLDELEESEPDEVEAGFDSLLVLLELSFFDPPLEDDAGPAPLPRA
jgi:hypothetical protein